MASEYRDTHKLSRLKALDHLKLRTNNPRIGKEGEIPMSALVEYMKTKIPGGGGGSFLPNGIEFVSESRDFQATDAGKRLFITGENTVISMPEVNPFAVGDYVGIINDGTNISFTTEYGGDPIFPLKTGDGANSECVVLMNTEAEGSSWLTPISTSFKYDDTVSKKKTALRYLMDNVGALYPNGVEVVTATRDFQESDIGKFLFLADGVGLTMPTSAPFYPNNKLIGVFAGSTNYPCDNFYEMLPGKQVYLYGVGYAAQGSNESLTLITGSNFDNSQQTVAPVNGTPVFVNEGDTVGYTATRYLMDTTANANSYRTEETKTGGTWIDGKPIYRKTFVLTTISTSGFSLENVNYLDIDSIVYINGTCKSGPSGTLPLNSTFISDGVITSFIADVDIDGDAFIRYKYYSYNITTEIETMLDGIVCVITLEYTKTTD